MRELLQELKAAYGEKAEFRDGQEGRKGCICGGKSLTEQPALFACLEENEK